MKTAEEIKREIDRLEMELQHAELTEGYVSRIAQCQGSGATHKWRLESCEVNIDQDPVYMWGRMNPVTYEPGRRTEKALLRCFCGVRLTFEEG